MAIKKTSFKGKNNRYERLKEIIKTAAGDDVLEVLTPCIERMADCEKRMEDLQSHDFIIFNPKNRNQSKQTETFKQWQRLTQVYQNDLKIVLKSINGAVGDDTDALDEFIAAWRK